MVGRYKGKKPDLRLIDAPVLSPEEAAAAAKKEERNRVLDEAAKMTDAEFEEQRFDLLEKLGGKASGWRMATLEKERIKRRRARGADKPPPPPPPSIAELAKEAADLIAEPDVLAAFRQSVSKRLAGEANTAQLIYLCMTSRLFEKPMNLAIKGLSAIGKSHLRDRVFDYIPPEDVVAVTTMTDKALLYLPNSLAHKIFSMAEALGSRDHELQDYLIREIISEGRITHLVTVPGAPGELAATQRKVIEGPIMFVTTTTRATLHPEIETRILSVETDDTHMQTRRVVMKVAEIECGLGVTGPDPDLKPWLAFQRWLAGGECRVVFPDGPDLARHEDLDVNAVRMRRDFFQVICAVKAHALLNREHRERDGQGRIVATLDDYGAVYDLMADRLAHGTGTKLNKYDMRVLEAVRELESENDELKKEPVKSQRLVDVLNLNQTTINRRLMKLVFGGYLENTNPGKGRTGLYITSGKHGDRDVLPAPENMPNWK